MVTRLRGYMVRSGRIPGPFLYIIYTITYFIKVSRTCFDDITKNCHFVGGSASPDGLLWRGGGSASPHCLLWRGGGSASPDGFGGMTGRRRSKKGKRRAAGEGARLPDTFSPPPFFFPCITLARRRRHSARRDSGERNLHLSPSHPKRESVERNLATSS